MSWQKTLSESIFSLNLQKRFPVIKYEAPNKPAMQFVYSTPSGGINSTLVLRTRLVYMLPCMCIVNMCEHTIYKSTKTMQRF